MTKQQMTWQMQRIIKQKVFFFSTKRKVYINYNRDFFLIQIPQTPQEKE